MTRQHQPYAADQTTQPDHLRDQLRRQSIGSVLRPCLLISSRDHWIPRIRRKHTTMAPIPNLNCQLLVTFARAFLQDGQTIWGAGPPHCGQQFAPMGAETPQRGHAARFVPQRTDRIPAVASEERAARPVRSLPKAGDGVEFVEGLFHLRARRIQGSSACPRGTTPS